LCFSSRSMAASTHRKVKRRKYDSMPNLHSTNSTATNGRLWGAGFPTCGCTGLSCPVFQSAPPPLSSHSPLSPITCSSVAWTRRPMGKRETRDRKVPCTRRQESRRYDSRIETPLNHAKSRLIRVNPAIANRRHRPSIARRSHQAAPGHPAFPFCASWAFLRPISPNRFSEDSASDFVWSAFGVRVKTLLFPLSRFPLSRFLPARNVTGCNTLCSGNVTP
jgi:hypothetical protein